LNISTLDQINWKAPDSWTTIDTIDMHTGGEPLRIPIKGLPEVKGRSVLEKRAYFKAHYDHIRQGLIYEPRGHADMYGAVLSPSTTSDGDFDVFFIHNEGYSTMCGHAIIALTKFVIETGLVPADDSRSIVFNVPAGRVTARAQMVDDIVATSSFLNVPSFVTLRDKRVTVDGIGEVVFDVAYGGAFYALVDVDSIGLGLSSSDYNQLIDAGRKIKYAVMEHYDIVHPFQSELSFLYGTIFTGRAHDSNHHSRNVCIFAEGEVDRSATGSGVSARASLHFVNKELSLHQPITIESILGTTMTVEIVDEIEYHGYPAVIPKVTGAAHFVGKSTFSFDPLDPIGKGFIFR